LQDQADIISDTIIMRRATDAFQKTAAVLKELKRLVTEQENHLNDPPDVNENTVKIQG
jgi:hypothetical protein